MKGQLLKLSKGRFWFKMCTGVNSVVQQYIGVDVCAAHYVHYYFFKLAVRKAATIRGVFVSNCHFIDTGDLEVV